MKLVKGCDASVLLDVINGINLEKDSFSNETLKGFDIIDSIKEELEATYPRVVSLIDILVLAARKGVVRVKCFSLCVHVLVYTLFDGVIVGAFPLWPHGNPLLAHVASSYLCPNKHYQTEMSYPAYGYQRPIRMGPSKTA